MGSAHSWRRKANLASRRILANANVSSNSNSSTLRMSCSGSSSSISRPTLAPESPEAMVALLLRSWVLSRETFVDMRTIECDTLEQLVQGRHSQSTGAECQPVYESATRCAQGLLDAARGFAAAPAFAAAAAAGASGVVTVSSGLSSQASRRQPLGRSLEPALPSIFEVSTPWLRSLLKRLAADTAQDGDGLRVAVLRARTSQPWATFLGEFRSLRMLFLAESGTATAQVAENVVKDHVRRALALDPHDALSLVNNSALDLVFMEAGSLRADGVRAELELWWLKLRQGGILAGGCHHAAFSDFVGELYAFARRAAPELERGQMEFYETGTWMALKARPRLDDVQKRVRKFPLPMDIRDLSFRGSRRWMFDKKVMSQFKPHATLKLDVPFAAHCWGQEQRIEKKVRCCGILVAPALKLTGCPSVVDCCHPSYVHLQSA